MWRFVATLIGVRSSASAASKRIRRRVGEASLGL
jgi:hypothetical protein